MKNILVINGVNMNMLGVREPEIYGSATLADLEAQIERKAKELGCEVTCVQSNYEGEICEKIQQAYGIYDGIIINPAAFTHYSYAIRDALGSVKIPAVEVHISNVHKREAFRDHSVIVPECMGQVCGLGFKGYEYAMEALCDAVKD